MSWLLCCLRPSASGEGSHTAAQLCANGVAKPVSPSKATTGDSLSVSIEQGEDASVPKPLAHAPSSRVRKASQLGLRLSEDTIASALSTTPTSLNPLAYVFPFVNDDNEDLSTAHTREDVDALGSNPPPVQPRSKVDFADLCGSLEDLVYLGEGSNGIVYSASWHGARVAVKFMLGSKDDSAHLQRCLTEAVLTRVLSHPCVVQCFATAIAQLTGEMWEAIRARCRRHASLLQSTSLGRSVAAAVHQQQQQERSTLEQWDIQQLPSARRHSQLHMRSPSSLQQSRHSPRQTPPPPQQQGAQQQQPPPLSSSPQRQQLPQKQPSLSLSQSQSQLCGQLLPSQDRLSAGRFGLGGGGVCSGTSGSFAEQALLELHKMTAFFSEELSPQSQQHPHTHQQHQPLQQSQATEQHQPLQPRAPQMGPQQQWRPQSGGAGSVDLSGEGVGLVGARAADGGPAELMGVSLLQALVDLKAEVGRHCTLVVMEYMDGGTLHQAIVRGDFSARKSSEHRSRLLALLLTAQELAQGMAHLHSLDLLHGDLKPTNVLLKGSPTQFAGPPGPGYGSSAGGLTDPRGYTTKIADLGLARPCPGETAELSSGQWGALAYLAPEAAKGSCCKASDVYSFGVMLWEMSAGVRPYLGLTTPQVLMGLVSGTLQLTWPSDGSLYAPLRSLAVACTDSNPAERPTFEVAARILGRMVRHIRSASEPLRQRHSSALSIEAAAAAAAAAAGLSGACGSSCRSPSVAGGGGKCVLGHASRSMPIYLPGAGGGGGGAAAGMGGGGGAPPFSTSQPPPMSPGGVAIPPLQLQLPRAAGGAAPAAISAVMLAAASQSCGGGSTITMAAGPAAAAPPHIKPQRSFAGHDTCKGSGSSAVTGSSGAGTMWLGTGTGTGATSAAVASGRVGSTGGSAAAIAGLASAGSGAAGGGTFWMATSTTAAAPPPTTPAHPYPHPYPRTRRGAGGGVCGGAVVRSPLGGGGGSDAGAAGSRLLPAAPSGQVAGGGFQTMQLTAVAGAMRGRPGSSPAHTHVLWAAPP